MTNRVYVRKDSEAMEMSSIVIISLIIGIIAGAIINEALIIPVMLGVAIILFVISSVVSKKPIDKSSIKLHEQWDQPKHIDEIERQEECFRWPNRYKFDFDIVGESNYQDEIEELAEENAIPDEARSQYKTGIMIAELIPEDDNPYDSSAIRVDIDGMTVGYLSKANARSFRRRLGAKKLSDQVTSCMAILIGGEEVKGKKQSYGIKLNIEPFA